MSRLDQETAIGDLHKLVGELEEEVADLRIALLEVAR